MVQFVLRRDQEGVFRFAALQSGLAGRILARHGIGAGELDTVYVVLNFEMPEERVLGRSDAVIFVLRHLGVAELRSARPGSFDSAQDRLRPGPTQSIPAQSGPTQLVTTPEVGSTSALRFWRVVGRFLAWVPRPLREWGYRVVARRRYLIFGRYENCLLPNEDQRHKFLDV